MHTHLNRLRHAIADLWRRITRKPVPPQVADARHERIVILTTRPKDPTRPTLAELNAGTDLHCVHVTPEEERPPISDPRETTTAQAFELYAAAGLTGMDAETGHYQVMQRLNARTVRQAQGILYLTTCRLNEPERGQAITDLVCFDGARAACILLRDIEQKVERARDGHEQHRAMAPEGDA